MNGNLIIFGGFNLAKQRLNDIHILQISKNNVSWVQPQISGKLPIERAACSALSIDSSVILFGGCSNTNIRLNDVFEFDYRTLQCKEVKTLKEKPMERSYHYATTIGRRMFIIGGVNASNILNDVWYFDLGK